LIACDESGRIACDELCRIACDEPCRIARIARNMGISFLDAFSAAARGPVLVL
jgi:hypothetical protein